MNQKMYELLNDQINKELYSAYLYLDMSLFYSAEGLDGFANWFKIQAMEERDHALMYMEYILDNGEKVCLDTIAKSEYSYEKHIDPLTTTLEHEKKVTQLINNIYAEAVQSNDFRAQQFLSWFISEQREEEKNASDLIQKMKLFGDDAKSLYMLNSELAGRVYTAPAIQST